jgi:glycosyltransferase involved in cell wall biosynthesis
MVKEKKIAFVIHGLPMGVAEKFMIGLANHFKNKNYKIHIILLSNDDELIKEVPSVITVTKILKNSRFDSLVTKRIKQYIQKEGINKIICINSYAYFLTKIAYIGNKDTIIYVSLHTTKLFSRKSYLQNIVYFRFIDQQDCFIYICINQREYLRKKYWISPKNEVIIDNGIDTDYFTAQSVDQNKIPEIKTKLGIKNNEQIIIKVVRIQSEKNHEAAIKALDILHTQLNNKAHLIFAGNGNSNYINSLTSLVKELDLENYIHFIGNQAEVRPYYAVSEIFTLTSNSETFSLSALEAMAFSLPCSLTNIGGASEMIEENVNGLLTAPNNPTSIAKSWDTLLRMNANKELIRELVIRKFNINNMLVQYEQLIEN